MAEVDSWQQEMPLHYALMARIRAESTPLRQEAAETIGKLCRSLTHAYADLTRCQVRVKQLDAALVEEKAVLGRAENAWRREVQRHKNDAAELQTRVTQLEHDYAICHRDAMVNAKAVAELEESAEVLVQDRDYTQKQFEAAERRIAKALEWAEQVQHGGIPFEQMVMALKETS